MLCKSALLIGLVPTLLFGQAANASKPVPDDIIISFFFRRYTAESAAPKQPVEAPIQHALRSDIGLTNQELSLLKEVIVSCNDAYARKTESGSAEVVALAAQYPRGAAPPAAVAARIDQLERERAKVILDCMDSLKRGINPSRYANLENYIRAQGAGIRYVAPPKLGPGQTK
jgi:hypothetical protein